MSVPHHEEESRAKPDLLGMITPKKSNISPLEQPSLRSAISHVEDGGMNLNWQLLMGLDESLLRKTIEEM